MPWIVAKTPMRCGMSLAPLQVGYPLPGWVQRDPSMIRVLKSLHGSECVTWRDDGPTCPVPRADAAPSPPPAMAMTEAEQKDASWREWIAMKAQPWRMSSAPAKENPSG